MMGESLEEQVRLHLDAWIASVEAYADAIEKHGDPRSKEIEKLAGKWETKGATVEAKWIRGETSAAAIRRSISNARDYLAMGELGKAYSIHQKFERTRWHITALLDQEHIRRGQKIISGAKIAHEMTHGNDANKRGRWQKIYMEWEAEKARGTRKAADIVAARNSVSVRQVYRSKDYISKID